MKIRARHFRIVSQSFFLVAFLALVLRSVAVARCPVRLASGLLGPRPVDRGLDGPGGLDDSALELGRAGRARGDRSARPFLLRLDLPAGHAAAAGVVDLGASEKRKRARSIVTEAILPSSTSCLTVLLTWRRWGRTTRVGSTRFRCSIVPLPRESDRSGLGRSAPAGGSPSACWLRCCCCRRGCLDSSVASCARSALCSAFSLVWRRWRIRRPEESLHRLQAVRAAVPGCR